MKYVKDAPRYNDPEMAARRLIENAHRIEQSQDGLLMGARATSTRYGFDRFWRNIRTHTLHDPLAYKAREVSNFALNGEITSDPLYT